MESKIATTDRLRREGRWEDASQYREETRRKLRADGKSKNEAGEAAWVAMLEKYPPAGEATDTNAEPDDTDHHDLPRWQLPKIQDLPLYLVASGIEE